MPDGTTIEIPLSYDGSNGTVLVRQRRFIINWEPHRALGLGIFAGTLPALGESRTFDIGTLYCGDHTIEAMSESPEWTRVDAIYVTIGELRYAKKPGEPGYRSLSTTVGTSDLQIPYIVKTPVSASCPGVFQYITDYHSWKRREEVAIVTTNILTSEFTAAFNDSLKSVLNKIVEFTGAGNEPWIFESFTSTELSDRVTQLTGAFRSTSRFDAQPAIPGVFDVDIPELEAFGTFIVRPGDEEDFGPPCGRHRSEPTIVAHYPYPEANVLPPQMGLFLPIFQQ